MLGKCVASLVHVVPDGVQELRIVPEDGLDHHHGDDQFATDRAVCLLEIDDLLPQCPLVAGD